METAILWTIHDFIVGNPYYHLINSILIFFTVIGNWGTVWIILAAVLLCFRQTRLAAVGMLLALLLGVVAGEVVIKNLVCRLRPYIQLGVPLLIPPPITYSFPSGHTMSSFAAATVLAKKYPKWGILAFFVAILIGFSRLYLFVHYPTDVLAGAVLGIICGFAGIHLTRKIAVRYPKWFSN